MGRRGTKGARLSLAPNEVAEKTSCLHFSGYQCSTKKGGNPLIGNCGGPQRRIDMWPMNNR